jgi:hypothetical protein
MPSDARIAAGVRIGVSAGECRNTRIYQEEIA